jgi:hypothetical protein
LPTEYKTFYAFGKGQIKAARQPLKGDFFYPFILPHGFYAIILCSRKSFELQMTSDDKKASRMKKSGSEPERLVGLGFFFIALGIFALLFEDLVYETISLRATLMAILGIPLGVGILISSILKRY